LNYLMRFQAYFWSGRFKIRRESVTPGAPMEHKLWGLLLVVSENYF